MQQSQINPESLVMLAFIPLAFVAIVIFAAIRAKNCFGQKDKEKQIYANLAKQMNWNFSLRGEGIETAKPYFEYINQQILPDRLRLGVFPVNILWGNTENGLFAAFDYNYNNNLNSNHYNLRCEKGFLLISQDLNSPGFEISEKDVLSKGIAALSENNSASDFAENYQIKAQNSAIVDKLHASKLMQIFEHNGVVRAIGNSSLLCLFFRRNVEELPDLSRIQFQLNVLRQAAGFCKYLDDNQSKPKAQ